nr:hypothetical protein CFP56_34780 [Quercus suber]
MQELQEKYCIPGYGKDLDYLRRALKWRACRTTILDFLDLASPYTLDLEQILMLKEQDCLMVNEAVGPYVNSETLQESKDFTFVRSIRPSVTEGTIAPIVRCYRRVKGIERAAAAATSNVRSGERRMSTGLTSAPCPFNGEMALQPSTIIDGEYIPSVLRGLTPTVPSADNCHGQGIASLLKLTEWRADRTTDDSVRRSSQYVL